MLKFTWIFRGMRTETIVKRPDIVIGRLAGLYRPHVCLNLDFAVQPKHARLYRKNEMWWLEDLNTPNGTFLNDQRIDSPQVVGPGDTLRLGNSLLLLADVEDEVVPEENISGDRALPGPQCATVPRLAEEEEPNAPEDQPEPARE